MSTQDSSVQNVLTPVSPEDIYTNVPLGDTQVIGGKVKKQKVPRRILHFSDGTLEEYSTDEEEGEELPPPVDPKLLPWMPWLWYYFAAASFKALSYADFCGEKLAWFFGITTPKYQSAIDEFYRIKAEDEEEKLEEEMEKEAERQREIQKVATMEGGDLGRECEATTIPQVSIIKMDYEKY